VNQAWYRLWPSDTCGAGNRPCEAVVTMDSFSKAVTPRAETARREAAVTAASTKAARRLGRNDMADWAKCHRAVRKLQVRIAKAVSQAAW